MNQQALDLIIKLASSIPTMVDTGFNIYNRVEQIKALAQKTKDGTLTHADIVKIRSDFDAELADFNKPMDPK